MESDENGKNRGSKSEKKKDKKTNYWDMGDKTTAQFFTKDFISFLLADFEIKEITFLSEDAIKEAFKHDVKSDHVAKLTLKDGLNIGVILEFQHYKASNIWERLWEYAVLLRRKHGLTILPILIDVNEVKKRDGKKAVNWVKRPMMQLELFGETINIDTFGCLVFKVNLMRDIELLTRDEPGIWTLLPFTQTEMTPGEMADGIIKRLVELDVEQETINKVISMLGYYLEGMYMADELEEFNETLRRWSRLSVKLKHVGRPWREEGRQEGKEEGQLMTAREAVLEILEERFGAVDASIKQAVETISDLAKLKELHKKSIKVQDQKEFGKLI